jgi:hypothetical protein
MDGGRKIFWSFVLLAITLLFFFPLSFGSFQSTHGPTTTVTSGSLTADITLAGIAVIVLFLPASTLQQYRSEALRCSDSSRSRQGRELLCTFRC